MGEKRRLSGRESTAKRRAAKPIHLSRKKISAPAVIPVESSPSPFEPVQKEEPLPVKVEDGEGLPVLPAPQPSNLPTDEYQSIAERY